MHSDTVAERKRGEAKKEYRQTDRQTYIYIYIEREREREREKERERKKTPNNPQGET